MVFETTRAQDDYFSKTFANFTECHRKSHHIFVATFTYTKPVRAKETTLLMLFFGGNVKSLATLIAYSLISVRPP